MEYNVRLPLDESGRTCYEIRLESIGGLGANLCGKMLGELGALYMGLNSASFANYGSEKRGSPVKAFIRWSSKEREIRINSPVEHPHILGLFHDAMIGKISVASGVDADTKIVVNTALNPADIYSRLNLNEVGGIYCVDAQKIAMETKSRINMVMLGAIAKASGFIPLDAVIELAKNTVGKKYPELIEANINGIKRGYGNTDRAELNHVDSCGIQTAAPRPVEPRVAASCPAAPHPIEPRAVAPCPAAPHLVEACADNAIFLPPHDESFSWGYLTAPIGGVNPIYGSTVSNDLSASREGYIPLFIQDKCINCGLCDTTCPDMVFQFEPGEYKGKPAMVNNGLDYSHCKGCLRCVAVCPTNALVTGIEREHPSPEWNRRNKDLITGEIDYDKVGANSYVTSEAYLQEKRVDAGAEGGVL